MIFCLFCKVLCVADVDNHKIIVAKYFYVFFVSVKGQSVKVTPDPVIGIFGGSVDITWTLTKEAENDKINSVRIFLGNQSEGNVLYEGVSKFTKLDYAKTNFGDRMKANFQDSKYTLTLSNLSFSDLFTFTLIVGTEDSSFKTRPNVIKSVKISEVRGRRVF